MADVIDGREVWHGGVGGEEIDGVKHSIVVGFWVGYGVTSVVFEGRADVPAFSAMGTPRAAIAWFFMGNDFGARRGKGSRIEVKGAVEESVGADFGVDAGGV